MGPNDPVGGTPVHVGSQLNDYLLGALSRDKEFTLEAHLLHCARCRVEYEELGTVAARVAALPPAVVAAIENASTSIGPMPSGRRGRPPTAGGAPVPTAPTDTRPERGPGTAVSPRRRVLWQAVAVVAAFGLGAVGGAAGWALAHPGQVQVRVDNETRNGATGRLTVTVTDRPGGGADVRVVALGLRPGLSFDLIAVVDDGHNYVVASGLAVGGPQIIVGVIPVKANHVRFLAVRQDTGDAPLVASVP